MISCVLKPQLTNEALNCPILVSTPTVEQVQVESEQVSLFDINRSQFLDSFCYLLHASSISDEIPIKAAKWLTVDMSIDKFNSYIPFHIAPIWEKGITKINVAELASLGLNEARCRALQWGFDLGLSKLPPYQSVPPENYDSLTPYGDLVLDKLLKDANKGVIELFTPKPDQAYWFHPLGAVPKGESDCRIVVDTSMTGLNDVIHTTSMSLPSLSSILNSIKKGWFACTYDLTSGFYQLPLRNDMTNFVCIRLPGGKCGRFRFVCFGLKCAPFIFQGTMMDIRNLLIKHGVISCAIVIYIDDFMLAAASKLLLQQNRDSFELFMHKIGLLLNPDKKSDIKQRFIVIGYEIDTIDLWVSIPQDKFLKRKGMLDPLLQTGACDWGTFQKIAGKLNHLASVTCGGRHYLHAWWKIVKNTIKNWSISHPNSKHPPSYLTIDVSGTDMINSLVWWKHIIDQEKPPRRPIFERLDGFLDIFSPDFFWWQGKFSGLEDRVLSYVRNNTLLLITSDASAIGGGWFYNDDNEGFSYFWSPATAFASSNFRELLTIELACSKATPSKSIQGIWVRSDNTASVGSINKLRSDSDNLFSILIRLVSLLQHKKVEIAATHIPGELNVRADALSRYYSAIWDNARITRQGFARLASRWAKCHFLYFTSLTPEAWSTSNMLRREFLQLNLPNSPSDHLWIVLHPTHAITMIKSLFLFPKTLMNIGFLLPSPDHPVFQSQPGPATSLLVKYGFAPFTIPEPFTWYTAPFSTSAQYELALQGSIALQWGHGVSLKANQVFLDCVMQCWYKKL